MAEEIIHAIWHLWNFIRKQKPLVHCITNNITINDCANILLAAGASPTMAHHPAEVEEITLGCSSLVCNLGATESLEAMLLAGKSAAGVNHPVILDPVGVSGSSFRRGYAYEFIKKVHPACIRGNLSEIRALAFNQSTISGVDAAGSDSISIQNCLDTVDMLKNFSNRTRSIVIASGETDFLTDGNTVYGISNGSVLMPLITGSGCMSSALLGAFFAVEASLQAALSACVIMGVCGELAEEKTKAINGGTMTFHDQLIDSLFHLTEMDILERATILSL